MTHIRAKSVALKLLALWRRDGQKPASLDIALKLAVLVLVGILGVCIQASPVFSQEALPQLISTSAVPAQDSIWVKYADPTLEFSWSLPKDWNVTPLRVEDGEDEIYQAIFSSQTAEDFFSVWAEPISPNVTLKNWVEQRTDQYSTDAELISVSSGISSETLLVLNSPQTDRSAGMVSVFVRRATDVLIIECFSSPDQPSIALFRQALSTLRSREGPALGDSAFSFDINLHPKNISVPSMTAESNGFRCEGGGLFLPTLPDPRITANWRCFANEACPSYGPDKSFKVPHAGLDMFHNNHNNKEPGVTPVYAAGTGQVLIAPPRTKATVVLKHQDLGIFTLYTHMADSEAKQKYGGYYRNGIKERDLKIGETVNANDQIGLMGNYNAVTHLHFSITPLNKPGQLESPGYDNQADTVDPTSYLRAKSLNFEAMSASEKISYANSGGAVFECLPPPCPGPDPNAVILYKEPNYQCGGKGEGEGWLKFKVPDAGYTWGGGEIATVAAPLGSIRFPKECRAAILPFDPGKQYKIESLSSGLFLDVEQVSNKNNASIIQWAWNGGSNQRWRFEPVARTTDQYQIRALNSNKCLGVSFDQKAVQFECSSTNINQWWEVEPTSEGTLIRNMGQGQSYGKVLDVPGSSRQQGEKIILFPQNDGLNQKWKISEVSEIILSITNHSMLWSASADVDDKDWSKNLSGVIKAGDEFSYSVQHVYQICPSSAQNSTQSLSPCISNAPPSSPVLTMPSDGYAPLNIAPTLCWQRSSDPNGNRVEYYVDIYDSPVELSSGWVASTCWRPSMLDWQNHTYRWRVKARDSLLAESAWSQTRTFTVASPNKPPAISLNTANGSSAGSIDLRTRNWTFTGTASDPEGQLNRIEWRCSGDGCGAGPTAANGTTTWSYNRTDMAGQNDIYFMAYDAYGNNTPSRHVVLNIDLAAPTTTAALNDESNAANWPAWHTAPVAVRLSAQDGATGRARVGVRDVHYRLDGGAWQTQGGDTVNFTVNSDGAHTVEYYAVDQLDNQEAASSLTFRIDQTPPGPPSGAAELGGAAHDRWQRGRNTPIFTWAAAADGPSGSGLWGYQLYFGTDPNGVAYNNFTADAPRRWTPYPAGVPTGVYYLRGRTRDLAGNWSAWTNLFTFRYDGTPPENPVGVTHTAGVTSTVWQRLTNTADFRWPAPHDEGSGIKGAYVYWGTAPDGVTTDITTAGAYGSAAPLCAADAACTGYLRLRSVDNVDNQANDWTTAFILRYDNAPPTVDFTFNGGATETAQTQVVLNLDAHDDGSGVKAMRFSMDGQAWTPWEAFAPQRDWSLPAIGRQSWPLYVQVKDGVELESAVVSHAIYLEVNRRQPQSANFRLFDHTLSGGAGAYTSTAFTGRGTLGQLADAPALTSTSFSIRPGYEAGARAVPIVDPGYETFKFTNGVMDAGAGRLTSASFVMNANLGEFALPNNSAALTSTGFSLQPGFLAAQPSPPEPLPMPEPGPTPPPEPALPCQIPSLRINDGAPFTGQLRVTLSICAPRAVEMMLGNSEDLAGAVWEPYAATRAWTLPAAGELVAPRFVYARFRDAGGAVNGVYIDDIIYDPTLPMAELMVGDTVPVSVLQAAGLVSAGPEAANFAYIGGQAYARANAGMALVPVLSAQADGAVNIYINGMDDNSGLATMEFSASGVFADTAAEPFAPVKPWVSPDGDGYKTLYARFTDNASNISQVKQVNFIYDATPPFGWVGFERYAINQQAITVTAYLAAADGYFEDEVYAAPGYVGTVTDMRVGADPALAEAYWQPYTDTLTLQRVVTDPAPFTLYAQFRDLAGNVSEVYSGTYTVDTLPPEIYVSVGAGETLTRTVNIYAHDEMTDLATLRLSNDPLMIEGVVTLPYTNTVEWGFDERRVVWVQAEDGVGNLSTPYPAHAALTVRLGGRTWLDANGDGVPQPGETQNVLAYVPLHVSGPTTDITVTTSITGYYHVSNLVSGTYTVTAPIQAPNGYLLSSAPVLTTTLTSSMMENLELDFGYQQPTGTQLISFVATPTPAAVNLAWQMMYRNGPAPRFYVWRSEDGVNWTRITPEAISATVSDPQVASYSYTDAEVFRGRTYTYQLEDEYGATHGLAQVRTFSDQLFLPLITR